jgi:hypothetical protein
MLIQRSHFGEQSRLAANRLLIRALNQDVEVSARPFFLVRLIEKVNTQICALPG